MLHHLEFEVPADLLPLTAIPIRLTSQHLAFAREGAQPPEQVKALSDKVLLECVREEVVRKIWRYCVGFDLCKRGFAALT